MDRPRCTQYAALGVALVFALSVVCGGGDEKSDRSGAGDAVGADGPKRGGILVRRIEAECKTLNPIMATTIYELYVALLLYDPLIYFDENLEYVPVLAESYEVSDDHLTIAFLLRENIHWHDGKPITADDVKFTMDRVLDPKVAAISKAGFFTKLDRVEAVDARTVVFHWKEPYAPSLYAITQVSPIPRHVYDVPEFDKNPANRKPVGSGPYRFEEWRSSQYISVVRNEDYHDDKPYIDKVIFRVIEDDAVALNALKAGDLDEMRLTQIQWERQTVDEDFLSKFNKYHYYLPSYNYMSWNCRTEWFKDRRVRLAMTKLLDRESINAKIYSGYAKLISGPFYVNSWAYDRSVKPHPFDPQDAKRLLREAGWADRNGDGIRDKNGMKFEFELIIHAGSLIAKNFAELFQEECRKAGVQVNIRRYEGSTFFEKVNEGRFDACMLGWILDLDPDIYDTFHSSRVPPKGLNHGFYGNAKVDSLLELGRTTFDQEERAAIYHEVHRIMHWDQPYTFINAVPQKLPVHKRVKDILISPNGPFDFHPGSTYWYIDEAAVESARK